MNDFLTDSETKSRESLIKKKNKKLFSLLIAFAIGIAVSGGLFLHHFGMNTQGTYH